MKEIIFLTEEAIEGGFIAKAIVEGIFTEADTLEEVKHNIRAAVNCHFEDAEKPNLIRLHTIREEVIPV